MGEVSTHDKEFLARIDEVLHYHWDPIGVSSVPEARDEYSSYAGVVFSMLKRGATVKEVAKYLRDIRVINMGLGQPPHQLKEDDVAEILDSWRIFFQRPK